MVIDVGRKVDRWFPPYELFKAKVDNGGASARATSHWNGNEGWIGPLEIVAWITDTDAGDGATRANTSHCKLSQGIVGALWRQRQHIAYGISAASRRNLDGIQLVGGLP